MVKMQQRVRRRGLMMYLCSIVRFSVAFLTQQEKKKKRLQGALGVAVSFNIIKKGHSLGHVLSNCQRGCQHGTGLPINILRSATQMRACSTKGHEYTRHDYTIIIRIIIEVQFTGVIPSQKAGTLGSPLLTCSHRSVTGAACQLIAHSFCSDLGCLDATAACILRTQPLWPPESPLSPPPCRRDEQLDYDAATPSAACVSGFSGPGAFAGTVSRCNREEVTHEQAALCDCTTASLLRL